jgi:uncharacterized protein with ParB-like and HNH nuclease domain
MSTITPNYRTVKGLLHSQKFAIDEFQREYKWEKEQIDELINDLFGKFRGCYNPGDPPKKVAQYDEYFLGSIIVSKRDGKNFLIDGQQRVTSLTLLLIFLYREAQLKGIPSALQTLAPLIYSDNLGEMSFNLDVEERRLLLDSLFHDKEFNSETADESVRNMQARYEDIEQSDLTINLGDGLQNFIYWLLNNVGLIEIATTNDSDANEIFETMNDRGKPLSPADMLKAFLLAPVRNPNHRNQANGVWREQVQELSSSDRSSEDSRDQGQESNCIKAWLRAQHADTIRERKVEATDKDWELIGTTFHRWVRDKRKDLGLGGEAANLAFMTKLFPFFAGAYLKIQEASWDCIPGLEHVFYNAHNGFTLQNTVLLAPLMPSDNEETVRKKIEVTAAYLDIWIMRRVTNYIRIGYSSVYYSMHLLSREIRRKSLGILIKTLTQKMKTDDVTFEGMEAKGKKGIESFGLNQWNRRYVLHLLARLSSFIEIGSGRADLFAEYVSRSRKNPFDIEHIWAADFDPHKKEFANEDEFLKCRDNVGSLLLLPADVNRSLQDKTFHMKKKKYASENFLAASLDGNAYLNQPKFKGFAKKHQLPFKSYDSFGVEEQTERRKLVKALAERVWSADRLQEIADE